MRAREEAARRPRPRALIGGAALVLVAVAALLLFVGEGLGAPVGAALGLVAAVALLFAALRAGRQRADDTDSAAAEDAPVSASQRLRAAPPVAPAAPLTAPEPKSDDVRSNGDTRRERTTKTGDPAPPESDVKRLYSDLGQRLRGARGPRVKIDASLVEIDENGQTTGTSWTATVDDGSGDSSLTLPLLSLQTIARAAGAPAHVDPSELLRTSTRAATRTSSPRGRQLFAPDDAFAAFRRPPDDADESS